MSAIGSKENILAMAVISGQGQSSVLPCVHDICFSRSVGRRVGSPVFAGAAWGVLAQCERLRTDFHLLHGAEIFKPKLALWRSAPAFPRSVRSGAPIDEGGKVPRFLCWTDNRGPRDAARSGKPRSSRHSFMRCALKRNVGKWSGTAVRYGLRTCRFRTTRGSAIFLSSELSLTSFCSKNMNRT